MSLNQSQTWLLLDFSGSMSDPYVLDRTKKKCEAVAEMLKQILEKTNIEEFDGLILNAIAFDGNNPYDPLIEGYSVYGNELYYQNHSASVWNVIGRHGAD